MAAIFYFCNGQKVHVESRTIKNLNLIRNHFNKHPKMQSFGRIKRAIGMDKKHHQFTNYMMMLANGNLDKKQLPFLYMYSRQHSKLRYRLNKYARKYI